MKRLLATLITLAALALPAVAADVRPNGPYNPAGYCQLTSLSAAVLISTCSGGIPARATIAQICVETQAIRYRDDGTAPTASVGMPTAAGSCFQYAGDLTALRIIEQTASAKVDILFYK